MMELTSSSQNAIDISLLPSMTISNKKDDGSSAQKTLKKKRKYTSRKPKEKLCKNVEKGSKYLEEINDTDTNYIDHPNIASFDESCIAQSNKIITPFQFSLFLSMMQQRRNNLFFNLPVSLIKIINIFSRSHKDRKICRLGF